MFSYNKDISRWVFDPLCQPWPTCDRVVGKPLNITTAEYGLGAFATQSIKAGAFVGGNVLLSPRNPLEYSTSCQNTWGRFITPSATHQDRT